jgi:hypothetical protein
MGAALSERQLGREWVSEAQKLLLSLRDIAGASISISEDGRQITEINILAGGHRPPKQIVRDVRAALRAEYQVDADYRKISVAQRREPDESANPAGGLPTVLNLPAPRVAAEPVAHRMRFSGVTVGIHTAVTQVRVELALEDREVVGEASGARGSDPHPLIVGATLDAVAKFLDPVYALTAGGVRVVPVGGEDVVVVSLRFHKDRDDMVLTGSCAASPGLQEAVVYATLSALNRVLGRLSYREPVTYEIRPTSIT